MPFAKIQRETSNGVRLLHFRTSLLILSVIVLAMAGVLSLRGCQKLMRVRDWRSAFGAPKPDGITIIRSQVNVNRFSAERTFYFQVSTNENWVFQLIEELGGQRSTPKMESHSLLKNVPQWFPANRGNREFTSLTSEYEGVFFYIVYERENPGSVYIAGGS